MHDLHAADKILKLALETAKKNKLREISKITLELGRVVEHEEEILPENLEFNIRMLAKGTIAEKARIEIKRVRSNFWRLASIEGD